jgi:hypothetical protein
LAEAAIGAPLVFLQVAGGAQDLGVEQGSIAAIADVVEFKRGARLAVLATILGTA